jgi:hypothetical protein
MAFIIQGGLAKLIVCEMSPNGRLLNDEINLRQLNENFNRLGGRTHFYGGGNRFPRNETFPLT